MSLITPFKTTAKIWILANLYWLIPGILGLLLVLYIISSVGSCLDRRSELKEQQKQGNLANSIQQEKGAINVLSNQREVEIINANQITVNANVAAANLQHELNTDSGSRSASVSEAIRQFCADHPTDSYCRHRR
jgi:hypothetical protein